jgi:hypothetical protein
LRPGGFWVSFALDGLDAMGSGLPVTGALAGLQLLAQVLVGFFQLLDFLAKFLDLFSLTDYQIHQALSI